MPDPDARVTAHGPGARDVTFRPLARDDSALLHRWLVTPQVQAWWRSQARTPQDVEREYGPQADRADPTRSYIIQAGDTPVGMIQSYRHADYPEWDQAVGVPSAAGIDYLIGQARHRGHGIGLYPDVDVIVSVSQKDNRASCRALEKAGFALLSERELNTGDPSDAGISAIYRLVRPR